MFDDFWANRRRPARRLARRVAGGRDAAGSDQPYLMGYDLLNEPWMGMEWPTCLANGCPTSYAAELQPAMEARARRGPRRRPRTTSSGGSRSSSPAARPWTRSSRRCRARTQLGLLVAQLLPRRLPRVAGRPRRRRRELLGLQPRPRGPRARAGPHDARRADDERVGRDRQPARDRDRRRRRRRAPDGLDALGLQALERPDHRRRRAGAVPRRHRPRARSSAARSGCWCAPTPRPRPGPRWRCGSTPGDGRSGTATGRTGRSARRPGSSSARCTTRTATGSRSTTVTSYRGPPATCWSRPTRRGRSRCDVRTHG